MSTSPSVSLLYRASCFFTSLLFLLTTTPSVFAFQLQPGPMSPTELNQRDHVIGYQGQSIVLDTKMRVVGTQFGDNKTVAIKYRINSGVVNASPAGSVPSNFYIILTEGYHSQSQAEAIFNAAGASDQLVIPAPNDVYVASANQANGVAVNHGMTLTDAIGSLPQSAQQEWNSAFDYVGDYYIAEAKWQPLKSAFKVAWSKFDLIKKAYADIDGTFDFGEVVEAALEGAAGGAAAGAMVPTAGVTVGVGAAAGAVTVGVAALASEVWDVIGEDVTNWVQDILMDEDGAGEDSGFFKKCPECGMPY